MHGVPPHLLPQESQPLKIHFHCYHCGFDNYSAHYLRCPECGRRARSAPVPSIRLLLLVTFLGGTLLVSWGVFRVLWYYGDYVQGRTRMVAGSPVPAVVLRGMCLEECVIRAGIVCLVGLAGCLAYAYWVFEEGHVRRVRLKLMEAIRNVRGRRPWNQPFRPSRKNARSGTGGHL